MEISSEMSDGYQAAAVVSRPTFSIQSPHTGTQLLGGPAGRQVEQCSVLLQIPSTDIKGMMVCCVRSAGEKT